MHMQIQLRDCFFSIFQPQTLVCPVWIGDTNILNKYTVLCPKIELKNKTKRVFRFRLIRSENAIHFYLTNDGFDPDGARPQLILLYNLIIHYSTFYYT